MPEIKVEKIFFFKMISVLSDQQFVREKSMIGGANTPVMKKQLYLNRDFVFEERKHVPALYTCFSELIINSADAFDEPGHTGKSSIDVVFDGDSFEIKDNGPGIPIKKKVVDGCEYWMPFIACTMLKGSSKHFDNDKIQAGDNGFGVKSCLYQSTRFEIKTNNGGQCYSQAFTCDMASADSPVVEDAPVIGPAEFVGTSIKFWPYKKLLVGMNVSSIMEFLRGQLTILGGYKKEMGCDIYISLNRIAISSSIESIMSKFVGDHHTIRGGGKRAFNVYLGIKKRFVLSVTNNIISCEGGSHVEFVRDRVYQALKTRLTAHYAKKGQKCTKRTVTDKLFVGITCQLPNVSYDSQTKDRIQYDTSGLRLDIPDDVVDALASAIEAKTAIIKHLKIKKPDDYIPPPKPGKTSTLILAEGSSALVGVRAVIKYIKNGNFGTFSVRGVPSNVYNEIEMIRGIPTLSAKVYKESNKLAQLISILGIKFGSIEGLRFGRIIIATDQDIDGIGNITTLLLVFFFRLWPELLSRGIVVRWATPLIRDAGLEFYSDEEYSEWLKTNSAREPIYSKGLASHWKEHHRPMAECFEKSLYKFIVDEKAGKYIQVMCGPNPEYRKYELRRKRIREPQRGDIKLSDHILHECRWYHLEKVGRALPSFIDGLVPARRKILYGSAMLPAKIRAVASLGGLIKSNMQYHHGEESLNKTIINMTQDYFGANNVPFFIPKGTFGSLYEGPKSKVKPRYISLILNKALMEAVYPPADYPLLDYVYEDGIRAEPVYMCPVIPMSTLESREVPGSGWKVQLHARILKDVFGAVKKLISGGTISEPGALGVNVIDNHDHGEYRNGRILRLPIGTYIEPYIRALDKKGIKYKVHGEVIETAEAPTPKKLNSNLNFIGINCVECFESYSDIILAWYKIRHDLYGERIKRELEIFNLRIESLSNKIRFLELEDVTKEMPVAEIEKMLDERGFSRLRINYKVKNVLAYSASKGSYDYLFSLRIQLKSKEGIDKYKKKLKEVKDMFESYKKETIMSIWSAELFAVAKLLGI